jgi:radical SAM protein with 4Fe4S-binding SPASM domain
MGRGFILIAKQEINQKEFEIIKKSAKSISNARRAVLSGDFYDKLPSILGFKLTNQCNLRCSHCYEWNDEGYHNNMDDCYKNMDLDFSIVEKCFYETREIKSNVYLWGGEPLVYSHIDDLLKKLAEDQRVTAICTNGIRIIEKTHLLLPLSNNLELLIALDGTEKHNDAIRGKDVHKRVIDAIDHLMKLRKKGLFKGKVSVHTVVKNENIGIDNLIICLPWYISSETSDCMDYFYKNNFGWLNVNEHDCVNSWHAFKYRLSSENIPLSIEILKDIKDNKWNLHIKIQPDIGIRNIANFINGDEIEEPGRRNCLSIANRMDILPNGKVTSCKHFPEFTVGDLHELSISEIWNHEKMNKVREVLFHNKMPVCSKCNNFYLHGYKSKDEVL